ncbi:MAG: 23S rRNA (pseudouridine(1915)-N(3))-methyltransferase RlmH [Flavobacteriales bacterium AspAUS03]
MIYPIKIKILIVTKIPNQKPKIFIHNYLNHIDHFIPCNLIEIQEIKNKSKKEKESTFSGIYPKDKVCLLNERGTLLDSIEFSIFVEK